MFHLKTGWGASYPETTGYIIPTFLEYHRFTGIPNYRVRALRMADWECETQLADGGVQGGTVDEPPIAAVFNTGQVMFGWNAALLETGGEPYRSSLTKAADFLCSIQDDDGAWRKNRGNCDAPVDSCAYDVRTAWALALAGKTLDQPRYLDFAGRNIDYVIRITSDNGWTANNCLNRPDEPLLHTIAYTLQGLAEGGRVTGNDRALGTSQAGCAQLLQSFENEGRLFGRYDKNWRPTVKWRCLTGESQTAIVWFRLAQLTSDDRYRSAAQRLLTQVKRTQDFYGPPGTKGGIKGSHPVDGQYGRFEYLNWAAKFFADALMLDMGLSAEQG